MKLFSMLKPISNESLSIMIIPHSGGNVRQIKLRNIIFYSFLSLMTVMCVSLFILVNVLLHLNEQLDTKIKDLSNLQAINAEQMQEINELKSKAVIVSEKLSLLDELETQVRNMVGLKKSQDVQPVVSRSMVMRSESLDDDYNGAIEDEEIDLSKVAAEMDAEVENLNDLILEVSGQLKILDAKPDKMPASGRITSKFGFRKSPTTGRKQFHSGIDIANSSGTNIYAAGTGIVTFSGWNSGYGKIVIISHGNGYRSVYAHNKENLVTIGQKVKKGDLIAKMGSTGRSTGPHVHFEIHYNGQQIDPLKVLND
ncbi:MAG: peptidoglycan DD-metalloendopeptidase family protein [Bacillota bacterium]